MNDLWSLPSWQRTVIAAVIALLVGVILILGSLRTSEEKWYRPLLAHLGSFFVASFTLLLVFEYWQKGALFDEMYKATRSTGELRNAKISRFSSTFFDQALWDELFARSTHLDILYTYGRTWRNNNARNLNSLLNRDDGRLRVVLPDPDESIIAAELENRFGIKRNEIGERIREAIGFFWDLKRNHPDKVEVYLVSFAPTHTFYRFNSDAVLSLYTYVRRRGEMVPALAVERGGELYDFIEREWENLTKDGIENGSVRMLDATEAERLLTPQVGRASGV